VGESPAAPRAEIAARTLLFVLGLGTLLGLAAFALLAAGNLLDLRYKLRLIGGMLVLLFGGYLVAQATAGFSLAFLERPLKLERAPGTRYASAYLLGLFFSAGWTPCIGPMLTLIIGWAGTQAHTGDAVLLLLFYLAGLALPFLAVGLAAGWAMRALEPVRRHTRGVTAASGVLLIVMGVILITDNLTLLNQLVPVQLPI
jgi:cytochrome c-type biogenesis protein